jgi:hypothetical protein
MRIFKKIHIINAITTGTALLQTLQECYSINADEKNELGELYQEVTRVVVFLEHTKNHINLLIALD